MTRTLLLPAPIVSPYFATTALLAMVIFCCSFFFAAPLAHADGLSQDQLQSVQSLLSSYGVGPDKVAKVIVVLKDNGTSTPEVKHCPVPLRPLVRGIQDVEVTALQNRLEQDGYLSQDNVSGFFGSTTQTALMRWQADHGVVASGTPETTGFGAVGKLTLQALQRACDQARPPMMGPASASTTQKGDRPLPPRPPMPPQSPQSSVMPVLQFAADYSDSFNDNMAAVVAAPYEILVDMFTDMFAAIGVR